MTIMLATCRDSHVTFKDHVFEPEEDQTAANVEDRNDPSGFGDVRHGGT